MRASSLRSAGNNSHIRRRLPSPSAASNTRTPSATRRSLSSDTSDVPLMAASLAPFATAVSKIPGRSSIPDEAVGNPHHVLRNGAVVKFKNPYPSWRDPPIFKHYVWYVILLHACGILGGRDAYAFSVLMNLGVCGRPQLTGRLKNPDRTPPTVNVVKPEFLSTRFPSAPNHDTATATATATATTEDTPADDDDGSKIRATWLGHACYYVEYPSGLRILFDPVFEDCCSPWPVSLLFPRRYTEPPCQIADLPAVDAVVISHSHYDHLSHPTAMEIQKHHPRAQFFVGLGLEKWFRKQGIQNVTELDWWEEADLTVKVREGLVGGEGEGSGKESSITARVSCLPCQHTSARTPFDKDTTLWCSWAVRSGPDTTAKTVWFGGDTGYRAVPHVPDGADDYGDEYASLPRCPQFKQIGDLRGPFDLGLIPIGAYHPRAAFSAMHANPADAVEIFRDTRCRRAMGIHWGTWMLTAEEVLEPPRLLRESLRRRGIPEVGVFDVCEIGESRTF